MTRWIILGLVLAGLAAPPCRAETGLADPKPSFDNPRKVVFQLSTGDPRAINNLLFNVVNVQKFYGMDNVRIAVVAFGDGVSALYRETSPVRPRIESLLKYDIEFIACGNTLSAANRKPEDLIPGVAVVTAGIAEIVERTLRGWVYIRP